MAINFDTGTFMPRQTSSPVALQANVNSGSEVFNSQQKFAGALQDSAGMMGAISLKQKEAKDSTDLIRVQQARDSVNQARILIKEENPNNPDIWREKNNEAIEEYRNNIDALNLSEKLATHVAITNDGFIARQSNLREIDNARYELDRARTTVEREFNSILQEDPVGAGEFVMRHQNLFSPGVAEKMRDEAPKMAANHYTNLTVDKAKTTNSFIDLESITAMLETQEGSEASLGQENRNSIIREVSRRNNYIKTSQVNNAKNLFDEVYDGSDPLTDGQLDKLVFSRDISGISQEDSDEYRKLRDNPSPEEIKMSKAELQKAYKTDSGSQVFRALNTEINYKISGFDKETGERKSKDEASSKTVSDVLNRIQSSPLGTQAKSDLISKVMLQRRSDIEDGVIGRKPYFSSTLSAEAVKASQSSYARLDEISNYFQYSNENMSNAYGDAFTELEKGIRQIDNDKKLLPDEKIQAFQDFEAYIISLVSDQNALEIFRNNGLLGTETEKQKDMKNKYKLLIPVSNIDNNNK